MHTKARIAQCKELIQRRLPRLLAVAWTVWTVATAAAYIDRVPPQLAIVDAATAAPIWTIWATAAVVLTLGVIVPSRAPESAQDVARWLRISGMMIICATLIIWTIVFALEQPRGWVTAKNYALIALFAAYTSWTIARDEASRRRVVRT